jgi:hypothetical protein
MMPLLTIELFLTTAVPAACVVAPPKEGQFRISLENLWTVSLAIADLQVSH